MTVEEVTEPSPSPKVEGSVSDVFRCDRCDSYVSDTIFKLSDGVQACRKCLNPHNYRSPPIRDRMWMEPDTSEGDDAEEW